MAKIHLRSNVNVTRPIAACAVNPYVKWHGRAPRNGRATYQFMASDIVGLSVFRTTPDADRCAHCCDAALALRNRQRREKGRPPVTTWNEGWT